LGNKEGSTGRNKNKTKKIGTERHVEGKKGERNNVRKRRRQDRKSYNRNPKMKGETKRNYKKFPMKNKTIQKKQ
jgi:hypothetical protein